MKTLLIILTSITLQAQILVDSTMSPDSAYLLGKRAMYESMMVYNNTRAFAQEQKGFLTTMRKSVEEMKRLGMNKETGYKGQTYPYLTAEKITFLVSAVAYPLLEGLNEGLQIKEKLATDQSVRDKARKDWHSYKNYERLGGMFAGFSIALDSEYYNAFDSWSDFGKTNLKMGSNLLLAASLFWIIHDEMIKHVNGWDFGFLNVSDFEKNGGNGGGWMVKGNPAIMKIGVLVVAFAINYLIYMVF